MSEVDHARQRLTCRRAQQIICSAVATGILVVLTSLYVGFKIGSRPSPSWKDDEPEDAPVVIELEEAPREEDAIEEIADGDLASIKAGWTEPCKMVCVYVLHGIRFC